MFQNYLCVISDNIRVNDNIFQLAWFPKYVVIDSIIIRNQTNVGCNGSVFVSVLLVLIVSDCRSVVPVLVIPTLSECRHLCVSVLLVFIVSDCRSVVSVLVIPTLFDYRHVCLCVTSVLTVSANIVLGNIFGHVFLKCIIIVRNQTNVGRDGSAIGFDDFRT